MTGTRTDPLLPAWLVLPVLLALLFAAWRREDGPEGQDMTDLPTLADPDNDPFLWLEEVEGERATGWADAQTAAATLARFGGDRYAADRETLRRLLDRPDNLPVPTRRGGLLFNFWRDGAHPRGLWRRTTCGHERLLHVLPARR